MIQGIRYLSEVVTKYKCPDPTIHNYLLSLYVKQKEVQLLREYVPNPNFNPYPNPILTPILTLF